jgi:hypothetical protein
MIAQQAQIIAYIDDYKLLMIATLIGLPMLLVLKKVSDGGAMDADSHPHTHLHSLPHG